MIPRHLIQAIIRQHRLRGSRSIHYVDHWARVFETGTLLASKTGARMDVVELFAVFHDAGRWDDGKDQDHGPRGAEIALAMRGMYFELDPSGMELLVLACRDHTLGILEGDVTVQTCWDSDRLDLGRAAIRPIASRLCTPAARVPEIIAWAYERSVQRFIPCQVLADWGVDFKFAPCR